MGLNTRNIAAVAVELRSAVDRGFALQTQVQQLHATLTMLMDRVGKLEQLVTAMSAQSKGSGPTAG